MADIKAIETRYHGCRFRSRLEARWAVWMDRLGIAWHYELQGFDLGGTAHLPDFWLPFPDGGSHPDGIPPLPGFWLEVKPGPLSDRERSLFERLARHTRHTVCAFAGDPWPGEFALYEFRAVAGSRVLFPNMCGGCGGSGFFPYASSGWLTWRGAETPVAIPGPCPACGGAGVLDPGADEQWLDHRLGHFLGCLSPGREVSRACAAFAAARSARFEHGETPNPGG